MLGGVEAGFLAEPSVSLSHAATSNLLSSFSSTPPFPHLLFFLLLLAGLTPPTPPPPSPSQTAIIPCSSRPGLAWPSLCASRHQHPVSSGYPNPTRYPVFHLLPDPTRFSFENHRVAGNSGTRTRPDTRYFNPNPTRYPVFHLLPNPTRFSFENHRVAGNSKYRVLPEISGKPGVSGITRYIG